MIILLMHCGFSETMDWWIVIPWVLWDAILALTPFQAVVGNWLIPQTQAIADQRISNAAYYDEHLSSIDAITIPPRPAGYRIVYHLYIVFAEDRDGLLKHCLESGIEAKVHYPVPIYRQAWLSRPRP